MDLCSTHHVSTSCSWNHHACICFNAAHRLSIVTVVKRTLRCERRVWHCPGATFRVSVGHTGCSVVWLPPSSQSAPSLASTLEWYLATSSLPLTCSKVKASPSSCPALCREWPSAGPAIQFFRTVQISPFECLPEPRPDKHDFPRFGVPPNRLLSIIELLHWERLAVHCLFFLLLAGKCCLNTFCNSRVQSPECSRQAIRALEGNELVNIPRYRSHSCFPPCGYRERAS